MNLEIGGVGLWARGLTSVQDLEAVVSGGALDTQAFEKPAPSAIDSKERRRAGLLINLAVEVAHQACAHARVDVAAVPSVFTSAMGDTDITDYMCRKLTQPEKLLSPTHFHNSVHNAPSGYWSISAVNRAPSTFVGGFAQSFGAALLEAACQALDGPVLLAGYDITSAQPFRDILAIDEPMGVALVLMPPGQGPAHRVSVQVEYAAGHTTRPEPQTVALKPLVIANPMGDGLVLAEAVMLVNTGPRGDTRSLVMPAGAKGHVRLVLGPTAG